VNNKKVSWNYFDWLVKIGKKKMFYIKQKSDLILFIWTLIIWWIGKGAGTIAFWGHCFGRRFVHFIILLFFWALTWLLGFFNQEFWINLLKFLLAINWCVITVFFIHLLYLLLHFLFPLLLLRPFLDFLDFLNLFLVFFIPSIILIPKLYCFPHLMLLTLLLQVSQFRHLMDCWSWL
jgi:hypothetical protein